MASLSLRELDHEGLKGEDATALKGLDYKHETGNPPRGLPKSDNDTSFYTGFHSGIQNCGLPQEPTGGTVVKAEFYPKERLVRAQVKAQVKVKEGPDEGPAVYDDLFQSEVQYIGQEPPN